MNHALNRTLAKKGRSAALIGGDCASLGVTGTAGGISPTGYWFGSGAGPAADGGYVLIGLEPARPALFRGIAWGALTVLAATRRRLWQAGLLNWTELPMGWDR